MFTCPQRISNIEKIIETKKNVARIKEVKKDFFTSMVQEKWILKTRNVEKGKGRQFV